LQIDYQLADLVARRHDSDRKQILKSSQEAYDRFLTLLDLYHILSPTDKKLYEEYQEAPTSFSITSRKDAAVRRENKIARFRQEKQLKKDLEVSLVMELS
jgi:immunoglobulin-binding protein 1